MPSALDTLRPRLSQAIAYSAPEAQAMRPYNQFMAAVTASLAVEEMAEGTQLGFCIFAACALEEAWKANGLGEADEKRFLEILVRYLLNVMKVPEAAVGRFIDDGPALMASETGTKVAELAARTFREYGEGDLQAASGFKFFVEGQSAGG